MHELKAASRALLKDHLSRTPKNPFAKFRGRFVEDLEQLKQEPLETFHGYAFATLRQIGACYELASTYLRWLDESLAPIAEKLDAMSKTAKSVQFKAARVVHAKKATDLGPMLDEMQSAWDAAMEGLRARAS